MTYLLENATPIWVAGAVLLTLAGIVYSSLRTTWSLALVAAVIALTAAGVATEWGVQTPREQAEAALAGLLDAVETNDLPGVLARLASTAEAARADAERLMPELVIEKANQMTIAEVLLDNEASPRSADVSTRVFVAARHRRSGAKGGNVADVTFRFVREGDRWLLSGYSGPTEWRRGAAELRSGR